MDEMVRPASGVGLKTGPERGGVEAARLALQAALDARKSQPERNRLGQYATPTALAQEVVQRACSLMAAHTGLRFLDPAFGTGAFYAALEHVDAAYRDTVSNFEIDAARGFEVDPHYAAPAQALWAHTTLRLHAADFTTAEADASFNLLVCNPPYVRHHHIDAAGKKRLQRDTAAASGMRLSGLSGLYCYFMGLAHPWMSQGAIAAWLIPSEFMDVNYGREVKRYLLERVTLLHIHRFDPSQAQFGDAVVSSAVVLLRNTPPPAQHSVTFTFGGALTAPEVTREICASALAVDDKWSHLPAAAPRQRGRRMGSESAPTLGDFFVIKRGIATGDNGFFIMSEAEAHKLQLPMDALRPILPGPRYLPEDRVPARSDNTPDIARRLFLLDTRQCPADTARDSPTLAAYLAEGAARGLPQRYLCSRRTPWHAQEQRPAAAIVCTYLGRISAARPRPFRFILNASRATVANVYLAMYPTALLAQHTLHDPGLMETIWRLLNALPMQRLTAAGRVYGGGLYKLEPKELAALELPELGGLLRANLATRAAMLPRVS